MQRKVVKLEKQVSPAEYKLTKIPYPTIYGYYIFRDKHHPLADVRGRVRYHRHVASVKLGRWVSPDEEVHHIDGVKSNNLPENLTVMSCLEHMTMHGYERSHAPFLTREELQELVDHHTYAEVGRILNIAGSAVRKRCQKLGVNMHRNSRKKVA